VRGGNDLHRIVQVQRDPEIFREMIQRTQGRIPSGTPVPASNDAPYEWFHPRRPRRSHPLRFSRSLQGSVGRIQELAARNGFNFGGDATGGESGTDDLANMLAGVAFDAACHDIQ